MEGRRSTADPKTHVPMTPRAAAAAAAAASATARAKAAERFPHSESADPQLQSTGSHLPYSPSTRSSFPHSFSAAPSSSGGRLLSASSASEHELRGHISRDVSAKGPDGDCGRAGGASHSHSHSHSHRGASMPHSASLSYDLEFVKRLADNISNANAATARPSQPKVHVPETVARLATHAEGAEGEDDNPDGDAVGVNEEDQGKDEFVGDNDDDDDDVYKATKDLRSAKAYLTQLSGKLGSRFQPRAALSTDEDGASTYAAVNEGTLGSRPQAGQTRGGGAAPLSARQHRPSDDSAPTRRGDAAIAADNSTSTRRGGDAVSGDQRKGSERAKRLERHLSRDDMSVGYGHSSHRAKREWGGEETRHGRGRGQVAADEVPRASQYAAETPRRRLSGKEVTSPAAGGASRAAPAKGADKTGLMRRYDPEPSRLDAGTSRTTSGGLKAGGSSEAIRSNAPSKKVLNRQVSKDDSMVEYGRRQQQQQQQRKGNGISRQYHPLELVYGDSDDDDDDDDFCVMLTTPRQMRDQMIADLKLPLNVDIPRNAGQKQALTPGQAQSGGGIGAKNPVAGVKRDSGFGHSSSTSGTSSVSGCSGKRDSGFTHSSSTSGSSSSSSGSGKRDAGFRHSSSTGDSSSSGGGNSGGSGVHKPGGKAAGGARTPSSQPSQPSPTARPLASAAAAAPTAGAAAREGKGAPRKKLERSISKDDMCVSYALPPRGKVAVSSSLPVPPSTPAKAERFTPSRWQSHEEGMIPSPLVGHSVEEEEKQQEEISRSFYSGGGKHMGLRSAAAWGIGKLQRVGDAILSAGKPNTTAILGQEVAQRQLLDCYVVHADKELGSGAYAVTRLAESRRTGEKVACKSISKAGLKTRNDVDDVRREHTILEMLRDEPRVARLLDAFEDDTAVYFVMELCEGGELFDRLKVRKRFSESKAAVVMRTLLELLQRCHERHSVVHRDIKPENILLTSRASDTSVKIIDFGVAMQMRAGGSPLQDVMGSPYYIAPEVIAGSYGFAADVWSAGVVLYILLMGFPPFWADSEAGLMRAIREGRLRFSKSIPLSDAAKDLVTKMLTRDQSKRITAEAALGHPWLTTMSRARGSVG